jgi:hypothetical protein
MSLRELRPIEEPDGLIAGFDPAANNSLFSEDQTDWDVPAVVGSPTRYTLPMASRDHYQRAFEAYIRRRRLPYVSVDEARRALLPDGGTLKLHAPESLRPALPGEPAPPTPPGATLKSFDFVVYAPGANLLVEVKGRKVARRRPPASGAGATARGARAHGGASPSGVPHGMNGARQSNSVSDRGAPPGSRRGLYPARPEGDLARPPRLRLESWVTQDDVESLAVWESLFGPGFEAVFAFVYWCEELPASALFEEFIEHDGRWYALRFVTRSEYQANMRPRSPRWRTVHLPPQAFDRCSCRLAADKP